MVKRTLVVLGILAMVIMVAGTAFGFGRQHDDCGKAYPLFVPVPCPPQVEYQQVIKTWSCKIEGPCPPPGIAACGDTKKKRGAGPLLKLAGGFGAPFDVLFGGTGAVYGCRPKRGGDAPSYGPVSGFVVSGPVAFCGMVFDTMW